MNEQINQPFTIANNESIVYHSGNSSPPIVIDTGASVLLTPNKSDFISKICMSHLKELKGLQGETPVLGKGTVEWTIWDLFSAVQTICTEAYYVPDASVRLFSPQTYKDYTRTCQPKLAQVTLSTK